MGAKGGAEHHNVVKLKNDQAAVLASVRQGIDVKAAVGMTGRKPEVLKKWLADPKFTKDLDLAKSDGEQAMERALPGGDRTKIDYATFSKEFLNAEVFPHHQSWIDVLEGREPSWIHPAMTYEPSSPKRLLVNVPPVMVLPFK